MAGTGRLNRWKRQKHPALKSAEEMFVRTLLTNMRKRLELSQEEFATRYGFNLDSIRNWEQGRVVPNAATILLLRLISKAPSLLEKLIREIKEGDQNAD